MLKLHRDARSEKGLAVALWIGGGALASTLAYAAAPAAVTPAPASAPAPAVTPAPVQVVAAAATVGDAPLQASARSSTTKATPERQTAAAGRPKPAQVAMNVADTPKPAPPAETPVALFTPRNETVTLSFREVDLRAFVQVMADFTSAKFTGREHLKAIGVQIPRTRTTPVYALKTVLSCTGNTLTPTDYGYAIGAQAGDPPALSDVNACINAGLPAAPEKPDVSAAPEATPSPLLSKRYSVDMEVFQDGVLVKTARANARVSEPFTAQVSENLTLECAPYVFVQKLYVGCKAHGPNLNPQLRNVLVERGHMKRVEPGKSTTVDFTRLPGTTMQMVFTEVES